MVLHKTTVGKNEANVETKIYKYPHKLSTKRIFRSKFPQNIIAT